MKRKVYLSAMVLLSLITVNNAYALYDSGDNDAEEVLPAPVNLIQAVTTAQNRLDGKAVRAELENSNGKLIYEIEIVTPDRVMDVEIDAKNGNLLSAKEDEIDKNNEDNRDDKDDFNGEEIDD